MKKRNPLRVLFISCVFFAMSSFVHASQGRTPLMKHIMWFAKDGKLTYESMMQAHKNLGIKDCVRLMLKIQAIHNIGVKLTQLELDEIENNVSRFAAAFESERNPASAGIWLPGGEVDEVVLDSICDQAVEHNGLKVITRQIIDSHLAKRTTLENKEIATWVGPWIFKIIPIRAETITNGAFNEFFEVFGDVEGRKDAVTVERFREFYLNSDAVFQELEAKVMYEDTESSDEL